MRPRRDARERLARREQIQRAIGQGEVPPSTRTVGDQLRLEKRAQGPRMLEDRSQELVAGADPVVAVLRSIRLCPARHLHR